MMKDGVQTIIARSAQETGEPSVELSVGLLGHFDIPVMEETAFHS